MRPFRYEHAESRGDALRRGAAGAGVHYLAGGTTLVDLMKLDVMRPEALIDINALQREHGGIRVDGDRLVLGALARMSDVADHPSVRRDYPVIAQSLDLAASPPSAATSCSAPAAPTSATLAGEPATSEIRAPAARRSRV
jgi:xanthine dehydrogenase YagS FAD-binding subunit